MVSESTDILIITADPKLRRELEVAFEALGSEAPVVHWAAEGRQGVELARNRLPKLVLLELTRDLRQLRQQASELAAVSPTSTLATVFRPDLFGEDVSESELIIEALHAGIKDFVRRPVAGAELAALLRRSQAQHPRRASQLGQIASFISNKGGVGKSTTSVNAAVGLAMRHPERVLLVDASLQMGVAASMLNLTPVASLTDAARERDRLDEMLLRQLATPHESGLHLLAAPEDAVQAAEVDDEVIAQVLNVARRAYDYVIVDTFPVLDRVAVAVLDLSDRAYVVLENVVPTLLGGVKMLQLLDTLGFARDKQRLILNRYLALPGGLKPAVAAARLGRELDFVLPYDKRVIMAANTGQPLTMTAGRFNRFRRRMVNLIDDLESLGEASAHRDTNIERPNRAAPPLMAEKIEQ